MGRKAIRIIEPDQRVVEQLNEMTRKYNAMKMEFKRMRQEEEQAKTKAVKGDLELIEKQKALVERTERDLKIGVERKVKELFRQRGMLVDKQTVKSLVEGCLNDKKVKNKIVEKVGTAAIKNVKSYATMMEHINVVLLGKTGVGKSTLMNAVLRLTGRKAAKAGVGAPITQGTKEYTSDTVRGLRIYDTKGIEVSEWSPEKAVSEVEGLVKKNAILGDPDKYIHAVWYCVNSNCSRFEGAEREALIKLMSIYADNQLPVIVVLTQTYFKKNAAILEGEIRKICAGRNVSVIPLLAVGEEENNIKSYGIDRLLEETTERASTAFDSAYCYAVMQKASIALGEECKKAIDGSSQETQKVISERLAIIDCSSGIETIFEELNFLIPYAIAKATGISLRRIENNNNIAKNARKITSYFGSFAFNVFSTYMREIDEASKVLGIKCFNTQCSIESTRKCSLSTRKSQEEWEGYINLKLTKSVRKSVVKAVVKEGAKVLANSLLELLPEVYKNVLDEAVRDEEANRIASEALRGTMAQVLDKIKITYDQPEPVSQPGKRKAEERKEEGKEEEEEIRSKKRRKMNPEEKEEEVEERSDKRKRKRTNETEYQTIKQ